jgi:hypothetical protein
MIHMAEYPKTIIDQRVTSDAVKRHRESYGATRVLGRLPVKSTLDVNAPLSHRHTYGPAQASNGPWSPHHNVTYLIDAFVAPGTRWNVVKRFNAIEVRPIIVNKARDLRNSADCGYQSGLRTCPFRKFHPA